MKLYVIGSLRNEEVPRIADYLRTTTEWDVFDDWYSAGPTADDCWRDYEKGKGHTYRQALMGHAAQHVFEFDKHHLDQSDAALLVLPAGKSCHLELGYMVGRRRPTFILLDEPDRWDIMYNFVDKVATEIETIAQALRDVAHRIHVKC